MGVVKVVILTSILNYNLWCTSSQFHDNLVSDTLGNGMKTTLDDTIENNHEVLMEMT